MCSRGLRLAQLVAAAGRVTTSRRWAIESAPATSFKEEGCAAARRRWASSTTHEAGLQPAVGGEQVVEHHPRKDRVRGLKAPLTTCRNPPSGSDLVSAHANVG